MEGDAEQFGTDNQSKTESCDNDFVTGLGRQQHVTPEIRKRASIKAQSKQTAGRVERRNKQSQSHVGQLSTPVSDEKGSRGDGRTKPLTRKSGRTLFPATSAAAKNDCQTVSDVEGLDYGANVARGVVITRRGTPGHGSPQVSGRKKSKQTQDDQETAAPSSERKRRRLYSQPVGVIEPAGSASGSQSGDNPPTVLVLRPKPSDTASRANESVYEQLLEHSTRKSNRAGPGGVGKKVPCGRKSAPPRVWRATAPPAAVTRSSPRRPRRRAAVTAASHLRDNTSDNGAATSPTSDDAPQLESSSPQSAKRSPEAMGDCPGTSRGSSEAATEANPQDDGTDEELERGAAEVFYMPTVVRSDDDSDDGVFKKGVDPPRTERKRGADDGKGTTSGGATITEDDRIWPSSDPDWEPNTASQSSPETSEANHQQQQRLVRQPGDPQTGTDESALAGGPAESAQRSSRSEQRSSPRREREMSGPSWTGSGRGKRSRLEGVPCYSRARAPSPDRSLRKYSYLTGATPERRDSGAQRGTRSRSRSGSRGRGREESGRGFSCDRSSRLSPRRAARPFFSAETDTEGTSPAGAGVSSGAAGASTSDSVSHHVLVIEQDPCWYRQPRRELGPNISSESSSTRRQQARSPPAQPRRRPTPWTYGPEGPDSDWAERQPAAPGPWRHTLVPGTLGSEPSGGTARPGGGAAQPGTAHRPAGDGRRQQQTPAEAAAPLRRSRRQLDLEQSRRTAAENRRGGQAEPPGQMEQDDAAPEEWPEPEPMEASPMAEQGGCSVRHYPVPAEPRPVPAEPRPVPTEPRPALAKRHPVSSVPQPAPAEPQPVLPSSRVIPSGAHPAQSGTHPAPSGAHPAQSATHPTQSGAHPAHSATHPAQSVTHPALSDTHPTPPGARGPRSRPAPVSSASHVLSDPQPVPSTPQTDPPGPEPIPPGPVTLLRGARPGPFTCIGSELAGLVARWRQLAKLEQQIFASLRDAQSRQQEMLEAQGRIHTGRLQEWKHTKAGILAACNVLERLVDCV